MTLPLEPESSASPKPAYKWPRFMLAAVVLAVVLAVIWMSYAIKRTRMIRNLNYPQTNSSAP